MRLTLHKMKTTRKGLLTLFSLVLMASMFFSCQKEVSQDLIKTSDSKEVAQATKNNLKGVAVNGVLMQAFYWDVPTSNTAGTWWQNLTSKAAEMASAGITAIWLPPAYKGNGGLDVGYGVYDRYDLGEFNQKGSVATRYGTIGQLMTTINTLHTNNIQVYEDIVMNHMMGADYQENVNGNNVWTGFSFAGRNNTYSSFKWNASLMNGWQGAGNVWFQWNAWDFAPYNNGDAYDNLMGCELRYNNCPASTTETTNWGNWITAKMSLDGYRLDAVKHMYTPFLNSWLDNVKGTRFAVGEAWINNIQQLNDYAASTGGRMSFVDVPLHYTFQAMSNGNGAWDMRGLQFAGFTEANGPLSVSFVENHDTDTPGALNSPVINFKMLAYAYILTREKGYPCVFYKDYYEYGLGAQIKTLIQIRKTNAYGAGFEYQSNNDADLYIYSRAGDASHNGLLEMLNDGSSVRSASITTPFKNATLIDATGNVSGTVTTNASGSGTFSVKARSYSVWIPSTSTNQAPTTTGNPVSGTSSLTAFTATITGADDSGVAPTLYYTTDGSIPSTSSANVVGSKAFNITANTTIKILAIDNKGLNANVTTYQYNIVTGGFTVNFKRPTTWGTAIKVYYWGDLPTGVLPVVAWPGVAMISNGNDWYSYTFNGLTSTNLIFTDGTNKSVDLTRSSNGWYKNTSWTATNPESGANLAPVVSVTPGAPMSSSSPISVTISATDDSGTSPTLYYTTNGSTPTTSSASAVGSKTITISATTTLKVYAIDNLGLASAVTSGTYTISTTSKTAVSLSVSYSGTSSGQDVYVVGSTTELGSWNTANGIKLNGSAFPIWKVTLNLTTGTAVQYKYFRRTGTDATTVVWETATANKSLTPTGASQSITDTW